MRGLRKIAALFGVLFVVFAPLLFVTPAQADVQAGLIQDVYKYDPSSLPEKRAYELCNTSVVPNMNFDVGGGKVADCQEDFVLIHWYGYITMPIDGQVTFTSWADDGLYISIGGETVIDNWWLKGCYGGEGTHTFEAGVSQKIDVWWYEYGGGACNYLYYNDPVNGFNLVPDSAFTTEVVPVVPPVIPTLNAPTNVQATADGTDVVLTWDTPEDSGTAVERYAVMWNYGEGNPGWGISAQGNSARITGLPLDTPVTFSVRADNDTLAVYSAYSGSVVITLVKPVEPPVEPPVDPNPPVDPPVDPEPPVKPPVVKPPVVKPPVVEPPVVNPEPKPEPKPEVPPVTQVDPSTIDPTTLTTEEVAVLKEVAYETLDTAVPGSEEYNKALEQLFVAAQADDIEVSEELASVPVVGAVAVGVTNAINFVGNVGADMSPKAREAAEKQVIVSVVAVGAAVQASIGAAASAAAAASSSVSSRKN